MAGNRCVRAFVALVVALVLAECTTGGSGGLNRVVITHTIRGSIASPTRRQLAEVATEVLGVQFVSRRTGFLLSCVRDGHRCAPELRRTRDAGSTWTGVRTTRVPEHPDFVTASVGFAARGTCGQTRCSAEVLRTDDGGRSWRVAGRLTDHMAHGIGTQTIQVSFVDARHGWFTLGGRLFSSSDGGRTWRQLPLTCRRAFLALQSIILVTPATGYVECEGEPATDMAPKALLRTDDGGLSWHIVSAAPIPPAHPAGAIPMVGDGGFVSFGNPRLGFLAADRLGLERTTDGGRRFHRLILTDDSDTVMGTSWPTSSTGFVAMYQGGLYVTHDGGKTWTHLWPAPYPVPQEAVTFASPEHGVGAGIGFNGILGNSGAILSTNDGGATWSEQGSMHGPAPSSLYLAPSGTAIALAYGSRTFLLRSQDDGASWSRVGAPSRWVDGISPLSLDIWYAAGRDGGPGSDFNYRTDDAGASWTRIGPATRIYQLSFTSVSDGWALALGPGGKRPPREVLRTTDGGRTWDLVTLPPDLGPWSVTFVDARHGWIGASYCPGWRVSPGVSWCSHSRSEAAIMRTTDGGATWELVSLPAHGQGPEMEDLNFVSPTVGFSVARFLYRTEDGGRTWSITGPA